MEKNKKLLYCILGSAILCLLNTSIFAYARIGLFQSGYGWNLFGELMDIFTNMLSLVGFILLAVFSITLIISNINFRDK